MNAIVTGASRGIGSASDRAALIDFARATFPEGLDLLVNNAAIAPRERREVLEATEESFDELINTNLKGPHFLTRLATRWMLEKETGKGRGRIVFVTSLSAAWARLRTPRTWSARSRPGNLDYCAGQVIHADGGFHIRSL